MALNELMVGGLGKVGAEHRLVLQKRTHELANRDAGVPAEVLQELGDGDWEGRHFRREGDRLLGGLGFLGRHVFF